MTLSTSLKMASFTLIRFGTLALSILLNFSACAEEPTIVRDQKPTATIVVPENAAPHNVRSAELLSQYIKLSTGATLPISTAHGKGVEIHIGQTLYVQNHKMIPDDLAEDGYILSRADPKTYVISGKSEWGTEFGVYEFLERFLNIRWLAPTDLFTEIPETKTVSLPEGQVRQDPTFLSREFFPIEPQREEGDPARASAPLWYAQNDTWGRRNKLRAHVEFHHNLKELIPPSRFGVTNPEFFPILDGERLIPPNDDYFQWQPNFSAPGLVEVAADEIITHFEKNPDKTSYSFGINDSHRFDESPESRARRSGTRNMVGFEDVSDDYYPWVNEVVAKVLEKKPDKRFGLLAYLEVLEPPKKHEVHPAIVPFLTYELTRWNDPEFRSMMQSLTLAWEKYSPELGWYDYVYGSVYLAPRFFPRAEKEALTWGANHNVKHYYAELIPNWGEGPNAWALTKLLWNPHQDVDALLDDWYTSAVGPVAAPKLKEYFAIWEKFWGEDVFSSSWYTPQSLWLDYFSTNYLNDIPQSTIDSSDRLLAEALELADSPRRKARVKALQDMWKVYRASIVARKGDTLWQTADLQTPDDVLAYVDQCKIAIEAAKNRIRLMGALHDDPLHGHSIFRFTATLSSGDDWGCASLWPLLPWVGRSDQVLTFLETLAASTDDIKQAPSYRYTSDGNKVAMTHKSPQTAKAILAAGRGEHEQLLKNPSFEESLENWNPGPFEISSQLKKHGEASLLVTNAEDTLLSQEIPYRTGSYYAKLSAYVPETTPNGSVTLSVTVLDDKGSQMGLILPSASANLHPGQWNEVIVPFVLEQLSSEPSIIRLSVHLKGFSPSEQAYLDDLGVYRTDEEIRTHKGSGPD